MKFLNVNKKAAYDLGRRSIYFIVVIMIVLLIFVYVTNSINSYQIKNVIYLNKVVDVAHVKLIEKCISKEENGRIYIGELAKLNFDVDTIKKCVESDENLGVRHFGITIEGQEPIKTDYDSLIEYNTYIRYFKFQNQMKEVTIELEKIQIYS
ncbi:MAG: hypothetical protein KKA79_02760 [Nanoarchaeota archaeon]|nr:hypothetical protein [Nanoarchaeota archaeon]MCG2718641.1 hypothetical protein [Nanoarchaeota archaeon]